MKQWVDPLCPVLDRDAGHRRYERGHMTQQSLVFLPLPFLTFLLCLVISVLVARVDSGTKTARVCFSALFILFAVESFLVGLRFGYGVDQFIKVQRLLPLLAGPVMYLGFVALAVSPRRIAGVVRWHLGAALVLIVVIGLLGHRLAALDWVIGASYLYYIVGLVLLWRKGPDRLVHVRLDLSRVVSNWMLRGAGLLGFVLVMDTIIAIDFALGRGSHTSAIISVASTLLILVLLATIFALPSMVAVPKVKAKPASAKERGGVELEKATRDFMLKTQLYLDPELSVHRLARRLHVPVRLLSAAINQSQGMNVSQYVNGFRVSHAADLLRSCDASVATIMAQSGFLTRSNFYREFQRIYGQSPAMFRRTNPSHSAAS